MWTISVLQDARRQSHGVTECITVTSFTLRLILQFYVLNFAATLKAKDKRSCVPGCQATVDKAAAIKCWNDS
jgi:hypothetical protein